MEDEPVESRTSAAGTTDVASLREYIAQVEGKIASPVAGVDINDPALAAFKTSILDEVAKKMAGDSRVAPPADIPWTDVRANMKARLLNGYIELLGTVPITTTSSSIKLVTLPGQFPLPEIGASYPVACREAAVDVRAGYITVYEANRDISFSPAGRVNEVTVSGIRFKAKWA